MISLLDSHELSKIQAKTLQNHSRMVDRYVITSMTDLNGKITSASHAFCRISGYNNAELIGKNHNIVRHPDMPKELYQNLWKTIKSGKAWHGEIKNLKKDGQFYWVYVHIEPILSTLGKKTGYIAIREDITDKKYIETLATIDDLTRCYNRRFYSQVLTLELSRAKRNKQWLGFLMFDADNFKRYNDTYGHQAGDEALISIAKTLKSSFKSAEDYVFRLGGEEFAVLYGVKKEEDALIMAENARQAMFDCNIIHSGNAPYNRLTLSAGLVILDPNKEYVEKEIYKHADESLYKAKEDGRNTTVVWGAEDADNF